MQARHAGFPSFHQGGKHTANRPDQVNRSSTPQIGETSETGAIVAAEEQTMKWLMLEYQGSDLFLEGYENLKETLKHDKGHLDLMNVADLSRSSVEQVLSKEEQEQLVLFEDATGTSSLVSQLNHAGHDQTASFFSMAGSNGASVLSNLEWRPPVAPICQVWINW